jgi:hypothetical protein
MFSLSGKVPGFILGKNQMVTTVAVTLLFAAVFLLVSGPFPESDFCLLSVLFLVSSRVLMYSVSKKRVPTFLGYILWLVAEAVLISLLCVLLRGGAGALRAFPDILAKAVFALAPPHIITAFYYALREKDNVIRLMNYGNVVTDETFTPQSSQKITLFDNNGVMKLSVTASNLYYIESDDNYIKVWYKDNDGMLKQYMLRCKLKTVEESFSDSELIRCHRKYIVNINHVDMLSRDKDGYQIKLDIDGIDPIPVTKTYESGVLSRFNSR